MKKGQCFCVHGGLKLQFCCSFDADLNVLYSCPSPRATTTKKPKKPCFPVSAKVLLENSSLLTMSELKIGDKVRQVNTLGWFSFSVSYYLSVDGKQSWERIS